VIVRLMGEGQYRIDDTLVDRLNELDAEAAAAVGDGDEPTLRGALARLAAFVREGGERLADSDLTPSDAIVPPDDLSLDEARELFTGEGLIPDLPAPVQSSSG
jgi:hypothetical protein